MKNYDKLIITAEPKVINMLMGILSRIHNGCTYIGYDGGSSGVIIPKEYDFIKVKRVNGKETKKRIKELKEMEFGYDIPVTRQEFLMNLEE